MGPYSVPKEILSHKPPGTMVKKISGNYYVYEYKSKKEVFVDDSGVERKKTITKVGKCIGKITLADGFVSNDKKLKDTEITVISYGTYAYAYLCSQPTFVLLKKHFNLDDAKIIYCVSLINFVNGFTLMQNIKSIYENSFLSLAIPGLRVGYDAIAELYHNLGSKTTLMDNFSQEIIDKSSRLITFDGHVIACASEDNCLSEYGYKYKKINSKQINWMTIYDMQTGTPLVSRFYNGAIPDQSLVKEILEHFKFKNTHFNVDRGFNNAPNKILMSGNGNSYTMPMISGRKNYNYVIENLAFDTRNIFIYRGNAITFQVFSGFNEDKYIAYQDLNMANSEKEEYELKIAQGVPGYTSENLKVDEKYFGLFILETNNVHLTPEEIFITYKKRWQVETYYNYIKHSINFNAIYQQDYIKIQGLSFIISISGHIYQDTKNSLKNLSLRKTMHIISALYLLLENNSWRLANYSKNIRELCNTLNFDPENFFKSFL